MHKYKALFVAPLLVGSLWVGSAVCAAGTPATRPLDAFFTTFTDEWMRHYTDLGVATGYFSGAEYDAASRRINPQTDAFDQQGAQLAKKGLARLAKFNRADLTDAERISADLMQYELEGIVEGAAFSDYYFPIVQNGAPSSLVSLLTVNHRLATPRDAENYVLRLRQIAPRMDEIMADARRRAAKRLLPPRFIIQAVLREMRAFAAMEPATNPLVTTFSDKARLVSGLDAGRRQQLQAEAEQIVKLQVYPAWRKAIALVEPWSSQTNDDAGLWRLPGGAEAYAFRLRRATTTNLTADQIHELGLRIEAEVDRDMDRVLRQLGYSEGSVRERYDRFLADQPRFPDTDQGVADYRADIEQTLADAQVRAAALFDRVPKSKVIAQPYPAYMGSRAASYSAPSVDGTMPGTFQFTLRRGGPKYSRSSIYHETVPGHHFQIALELENTGLPRWRRIRAFGGNSAITEGWALYAEQLAAESSWYEGHPVGLLSQLQRKQFRARRLVADTGLHAKRWTRQQTIDYLGPALETADAASETDRYVVSPGQACSYMVGAQRILELRERAQRELGPRFSLREFHNVVLGTGIVPLDVLEQQVTRWIAASRS